MRDIAAEFTEYRDRFLGPIRELIDRVVRESGLGESSLSQMLDFHMQTGGKRLRAILPLMVGEALGEPPELLLPLGAACELIHNATLVHDDLQDGDRVRRGAPAIWTKFGEAQAINLGDALLYLAPLCLDYIEVSDRRRWVVARRIFRDVLQVIDGQEREFGLKGETATPEAYTKMVVGKTSGLFALPMAGAAELCGADQKIVSALAEAAGHLGVIFQIQDDILDLYGEKGRALPGGDIREGKISALVVAYGSVAQENEVQRLHEILRTDREETTDEDVAWAIRSIRATGALDLAMESITHRRGRILAMNELTTYPGVGELVEGMVDIFLRPIEGLFYESEVKDE